MRLIPPVRQKPISSGYVIERSAGRYFGRRVCSNVQHQAFVRRVPDRVDFESGEVVRRFQVIRTGEIRDCEHRSSSLLDSSRNVRKRCNDFKWIIRANERDSRLFVTLTYKENMTDTKRLYLDFKKFWLRLKDRFFFLRGYIVAFEPQERGAWHAHVILLSGRSCFISNKVISKIWRFGYTKTQAISKISNLAEYVTSYLTNIKDGADTKKGARLSLYPPYFQFLRHSKKGVSLYAERSFYGNCEIVRDLQGWRLCYDYSRSRVITDKFVLSSRLFLFELDPSFCGVKVDGYYYECFMGHRKKIKIS